MKPTLLLILCLILNFEGFSQIATAYDVVIPFEGELTAVKKDNQWGFINKNGELVVDYRNDFVLTKSKDDTTMYPVFKNERCMVKKLVNNANYYGFIDTKGNETINPSFLNASNFKDGYAIVVKLLKDSLSYNKVLKKSISSYRIEEYVIDTQGNLVKYLENPLNFDISKISTNNPPKIRSKFIGDHLVTVLKKNNKWDIYKF